MSINKLAAAIVAVALTLTACSADTNSDPGTAAGAFNDADVLFAQQMIPHHHQALLMASMAQRNADTEEVRQLAGRIEAAQQPEIDQMLSWLNDWRGQLPNPKGHMMVGDGKGEQHNMTGMMGSRQLRKLDRATGPNFDRLWLSMMIEHHQGAVEMAQQEQSDGIYPDAVALAKHIETSQAAEIALMKELLAAQGTK
ncbi:MAG TPA: DUF305 domain-containing protein [Actinomycetes bacterium]|nr:DUF305 domain-containing protein [Actinomycetes bacterium]